MTIQNKGPFTETFNVTIFANASLTNKPSLTLTARDRVSTDTTWNTSGFARGNYTLWSFAEPVQGETLTSDNNLMGGWVVVSTVGDITSSDGWPDGKVDMRDVGYTARRFICVPGARGIELNATRPFGATHCSF